MVRQRPAKPRTPVRIWSSPFSSRKLAKNNAARERRTFHLDRVEGRPQADDRVFHDHYGAGVVTRAAADDGWWMIRFAGTADEIRMSPSFTSLYALPSESSAPSYVRQDCRPRASLGSRAMPGPPPNRARPRSRRRSTSRAGDVGLRWSGATRRCSARAATSRSAVAKGRPQSARSRIAERRPPRRPRVAARRRSLASTG